MEEPERPALGAAVIGGGGAAQPTRTTASVQAASANAVVAPLSGAVARVLVAEGDEITQGQVLLVLEAMKMETEITAPHAGTVAAVLVGERDAVQGGQALIELAASRP